MPDVQWTCQKCGDINPPFTEVCRNCLAPAPPPRLAPEKEVGRSTPPPLFDTRVFRSFRYHSLDEVSQDKFGIDPQFRPLAWLIFPASSLLAFLMISGAFDTFETGQAYLKGGRQITGEAAYLKGVFMALIGAMLPLLPIRGPKWFSIAKRCLWAVIVVVAVWSTTSTLQQLAG